MIKVFQIHIFKSIFYFVFEQSKKVSFTTPTVGKDVWKRKAVDFNGRVDVPVMDNGSSDNDNDEHVVQRLNNCIV